MTNCRDRIQASAERVLNLAKDKEALAVLALNDAAVTSREGKFFYLPESRDSRGKQPAGPVMMQSVVPRLLYTNHLWTEQETKAYWQNSDADRFIFIQGQIAQMPQLDVVLIKLIVQTPGMTSLSWPTETLASIVIYGPGPWYKLSWMDKWIEKASKDKVGETYTVPIFQRGANARKMAAFKRSVNAIGELRDTSVVVPELRNMLRQSSDSKGGCCWVAGSVVEEALAVEASTEKEETAVAPLQTAKV